VSFQPKEAKIAKILKAAAEYGAQLVSMDLDRDEETIRDCREHLYATLAYLYAVDADSRL
jgi:hypothetical protein